jgi:hypothetical protein
VGSVKPVASTSGVRTSKLKEKNICKKWGRNEGSEVPYLVRLASQTQAPSAGEELRHHLPVGAASTELSVGMWAIKVVLMQGACCMAMSYPTHVSVSEMMPS